MTRTEQAAFKRLDNRREKLFSRMCVIEAWVTSPWCAHSAEELVSMIAKLAKETIEEEKCAQRKEESK